TGRAFRPSARRRRRGSRSPLPRKSRLRQTRGLLPRPSPTPLGTGAGGLLLQLWARPPRRQPEVELLCVPMQRSQRLVGRCWVPLGGRFSALWDRVDGGGREGGRRRRRRGRGRRVSE